MLVQAKTRGRSAFPQGSRLLNLCAVLLIKNFSAMPNMESKSSYGRKEQFLHANWVIILGNYFAVGQSHIFHGNADT
jgi:hypothetical protein